MPLFFHNSIGLEIGVKEVVGEIKKFIIADSKRFYKIIIGTDSDISFSKNADFVTAVVVYRVGNGGRYFWRRIELGKFHTLRDRIIKEVLLSLDIAKELLLELKNMDLDNWSFEIHADVGENGETKSLIQEVVGIIRANNFEAKTKPDSYAATKVADRHI